MSISVVFEKLLNTGDISDIYVVLMGIAIIALSSVIVALFWLLVREKGLRLKDNVQIIKYMDMLTKTLEEQAKSLGSVLAVLRYSKCFKCVLQGGDENGDCNEK